jgi:hypothetical protein
MLTIVVPLVESFDEESEEFVVTDSMTLELEHSLVSLSKWESTHEKPFLGKDPKTTEETLDYIRCMVIGENPPAEIFQKLSKENFEEINAYLEAKMTATWFNEPPGPPKANIVITAELVYYWMVALEIPFECENWHLNRLFTLIRICDIKGQKPKKMSRAEVMARNRELNEQRKRQLGTRG